MSIHYRFELFKVNKYLLFQGKDVRKRLEDSAILRNTHIFMGLQ